MPHAWPGISSNEAEFLKSAAALAGIAVAAEDRSICSSAGPNPQELAREERGHWAYGIVWDADGVGWGLRPK